MRTAEELDKRHDEIVARFPDGITIAQYRQVVLISSGRVSKRPG